MPTKILEENTLSSSISDPNMSRIESFATSQELIEFIIDTLHLNKYYTLSEENDFEKKAVEKLRNNYEFSINEKNEMEIIITDKNIGWANKISKKILDKLNEMNNEYFISIIKIQDRVSQKQVTRLNKQKAVFTDSLKNINSRLRKLPIPAELVIKLIDNKECPECPVFFNNLPLTEYLTSVKQLTARISAIDDNIDSFLEKIYKSEIALELISEKKPIILEEKNTVPSQKYYGYYLIESSKVLGAALLIILFIIILILPELKSYRPPKLNGSNGLAKTNPEILFASEKKEKN